MAKKKKPKIANKAVRKLATEVGGAKVLAVILGVHRCNIYRWGYSKSKGGTGRRIPLQYHKKIMKLAEIYGWDIEKEDLLPDYYFNS